MKFKIHLFIVCLIILACCQSFALSTTLFGPEQYVRIGGAPEEYSDTFSGTMGTGKIVVLNGEASGGKRVPYAISSGSIYLNGSEIFGPDDFNQNVHYLEAPVDLLKNNSLQVMLKSNPGSFLTVEIIQESSDPNIISFSAAPETIIVGDPATLSWKSTDADTVTIEPDIGAVPAAGSMDVYPRVSTTYTITATGDGGTATAQAAVAVLIPPTVSIQAAPQEIEPGQTSTLSWTSENAASAEIDQGIGPVSITGSIDVTPSETTIYTATVIGPGGSTSDSVQVTVANNAPTVTLAVSPEMIQPGESVTLSWESTDARQAYMDNGIGAVPVSGTLSVSPDVTTLYTLTVTGNSGSAASSVQVAVSGDPESLPEGSFGERYEDLIPQDAVIESYSPDRFSVITGKVEDIDGNPLSQVLVSVHENPQYGSVLTDANGSFSIPVEGGGPVNLVFRKTGYISAQRKTDVPWKDIAVLETFAMITEDSLATTFTLDGSPVTVITHEGSPVVDEYGERSCTLVFEGDNHAFATDENGNDIFELTTLTVRATEFTTKESMPAELPPNSAYTYCVELSVDGVQNVRFEKPVVAWVDNFLGFAVGEAVPVGYYDRHKGVWVPGDNGIVVTLLDTDNDGNADALDADGDGLSDDLDNDGLFTDEVGGVNGDPLRYPPGNTFWRVLVGHFTPWDCNWPYGPPSDAIDPNPDSSPIAGPFLDSRDECKNEVSSYVADRSQIFHEDISIPGTGLTLHYASDRVEGKISEVTIPVSGEEVPASLKKIIVQVFAAGNKIEKILAPLPNQKVEISWNEQDFKGNIYDSSIKAETKIGFVYDAQYYSAGDFSRAFAQTGSNATAIRARQEIITWRNGMITLQNPAVCDIAAGWTLSNHHCYDPADSGTLFKGNGERLTNATGIIETIAGGGSRYGEGPALDVYFYCPVGIDIDAEGNYYIAETCGYRIFKLDTAGYITSIAGDGTRGSSGDGGPATEAQIDRFYDVSVDNKGNIFFAEPFTHKVRKVSANGTISTIAGDGTEGCSGDGGLAVNAQLDWPTTVVTDDLGNIFIGDSGNNRLRKVDSSGIITTVIDFWAPGYTGPYVDWIADIDIDAFGNIFIADTNLDQIVKLSAKTGDVELIAGVPNNSGFSGDGGPAVEALLDGPESLVIDRSGNIYFTDEDNYRIRKIDTCGIIATVAGSGIRGLYGDGGPPSLAQFDDPSGILIDHSGNIVVVDSDNAVIRRIERPKNIREGKILFPEDSGIGHIISNSPLHESTIDLATGKDLYTFGYNQNNRIISITDQFGSQTTIQRDTGDVPVSVTSADGIMTTLTVDGNNQLTRVNYPDGTYYSFEYAADGLLEMKTEPSGNHFDYTYNENGRLTDVMDEEGGHWHYGSSVDLNGDITTRLTTGEGNETVYVDHRDSTGRYTSYITGPDGSVTDYERSADGLRVRKSLPCGAELDVEYGLDPVFKFEYVKEMTRALPSGLTRLTLRDKSYTDTNEDGKFESAADIISVNGKTTILYNDILLSEKTISTPEGRDITLTYDPQSLLTSSISISGFFDTSFSYDARGRLTDIVTGSRQTAFAYDTKGFIESVTDPENHITTYEYDEVGRVVAVHRPDVTDLYFDYDPNGNMTILTNPSNIDHGFNYNKVDLPKTYQTPVSGSYSYVYDKDRRLIQKGFPSGATIDLDYTDPVDGNNSKLMSILTPEGSIDFSYLCGSKVESVTKGNESITYSYDGSLVTSEALSGALSESLSYTYNIDFNVAGFTYADDTESYTYDDDGRLTGAGGFTITRNVLDGLPEQVNDGALSLTRSFNGYGEIDGVETSVNAQNLFQWDLVRDNNGRITRKSEIIQGLTTVFNYEYDEMGRLTKVFKDGVPVEGYQYNMNGAREYEINTLRGITGRPFSYSDEDHLLTAGGVSYAHDLDGFLTSKTDGADTTFYSYSSRGELLNVTLPEGTTIEYVHDPLGRRIAKKVDGAITEKYLWKGLTRLLAVYDGSDNLFMRFKYADGRMPVSVEKEGVVYYLTYDQVGSVRLVADSAGNVVKRIDYDSFGNVIADTEPAFDVPLGFAGGLKDSDTGLVRFGYRDYSPDVGRWTAKDPILFAAGDTDLYGYVLNDPLNLYDPYGLSGICGIISGAISGGMGSGISGDSFSGIVGNAIIGATLGATGLGVVSSSLVGAAISTVLLPSSTWEGEDRYYNHMIEMARAESLFKQWESL